MAAHLYCRSSLPSGAVVHRWTPDDPRGVVVLQHGFGEYAERYVDQHGNLVPRLLAAGFEVRALDLWGHGRSPGRRGVTNLRLAVRDHLAVRQAAEKVDLPIFLIGHSLGGLITAWSAVQESKDVAGVVLLSPALADPADAPNRRLLGAAAAVAPWLSIPRRRRPLYELTRRPTVRQRTAADPDVLGRQIPLLLAATALDGIRLLPDGSAAWHAPTLVLHGTADTYTAADGSRGFSADIAAEDKELHLLPGAFHELLNDTCADEVLELITVWLGHRVTDRGRYQSLVRSSPSSRAR